jgi:hypothetical protein
MAAVKQSVNGWSLVKSMSAEYAWERRSGNEVMRVSVFSEGKHGWRVSTAGTSAEYGGAMSDLYDSFEGAKKAAYRLMRAWDPDPYYDGRQRHNEAVYAAEEANLRGY